MISFAKIIVQGMEDNLGSFLLEVQWRQQTVVKIKQSVSIGLTEVRHIFHDLPIVTTISILGMIPLDEDFNPIYGGVFGMNTRIIQGSRYLTQPTRVINGDTLQLSFTTEIEQ